MGASASAISAILENDVNGQMVRCRIAMHFTPMICVTLAPRGTMRTGMLTMNVYRARPENLLFGNY